LVKYLVYRMAYDESTAWFRVLHCLKLLRPIKKQIMLIFTQFQTTVHVAWELRCSQSESEDPERQVT